MKKAGSTLRFVLLYCIRFLKIEKNLLDYNFERKMEAIMLF